MRRDFDREPQDYLRQNYERDDLLAVVQIDRTTGKVEQKLRTAEQIADPKYLAHLRAANADGKDILVTVNALKPDATGRTKADIGEIRHVFLDVDHGGREALDRVLRDPAVPAPHHVIESSPGKYQVLWQVERFSQPEAEQITRELAHRVGADPAAIDSSRCHRLPGFRNCKYEQTHFAHEIPLERRGNSLYAPEDFPRHEIARHPAGTSYGEAERCPGPSGSQVRPEGAGPDRSREDFAYACRQLEKGRSPAVIAQEIADRRRPDGKKHDPDRYAQTTVAKAGAYLASKARPMPVETVNRSQGIER